VVRQLVKDKVSSPSDFQWVGQMRYYYTRPARGLLEQRGNEGKSSDPEGAFQQLAIRVSRASFFYGFEYLGVSERLVQTPLTDRVFLTLCEAMHMRMGGNPFGPAGTGKTESVKALGAALGRFVLVFNCLFLSLSIPFMVT
jgi:dynein heavy chain 1